MAPSSRQVVYADTNVFIEATRTQCLAAMLDRYDVRTVEEVRKEAASGNARNKSYVKVDLMIFETKIKTESVSDKQILNASLKADNLMALDKGERDLLAWCAAQTKDVWLLTTADKAAVKAACGLGFADRLRSLEELAQQCGLSPALNNWFTKKWLSGVKTEFLLGG